MFLRCIQLYRLAIPFLSTDGQVACAEITTSSHWVSASLSSKRRFLIAAALPNSRPDRFHQAPTAQDGLPRSTQLSKLPSIHGPVRYREFFVKSGLLHKDDEFLDGRDRVWSGIMGDGIN
jgi:hypothetical protein